MDEYLDKLTSLIDIKDIDYIIVDHTEPDHAGSAAKLVEINPAIKLVGTATAISFMKEICNVEFASVIVKEGDCLLYTSILTAAFFLPFSAGLFDINHLAAVFKLTASSFLCHASFLNLLSFFPCFGMKPLYLSLIHILNLIRNPFRFHNSHRICFMLFILGHCFPLLQSHGGNFYLYAIRNTPPSLANDTIHPVSFHRKSYMPCEASLRK